MTKVFAQASVSLDGFIAGPGGSGFDRLFGWCTASDVPTPTADPDRLTYRTSEQTAAYLRELMEHTGAIVVGRGLYDRTDGWGGSHPLGRPVFVVTHRPAEPRAGFTFVTDGVRSAIEQVQAVAEGKDVGIGPGSTVRQALGEGLVDEFRMDLLPVLLGGGTPMIEQLREAPITLGTPRVVEGIGVTHLIYPVR